MFKPDPQLFIKNHYRLKYLDELSLARLKRAAEKYYEIQPDGSPDLYAYKLIQTQMLDGPLWAIFCDFYFKKSLAQLLWIPY